jgi:Zn-dependent protease
MILLFISVLLHEFGHCFGARLVAGDANEILIWPLGGLAYVDVPHTPKAHFISTAAGPLVNLLLCVAATAGLAAFNVRPPLNPWWVPVTFETVEAGGRIGCEGLFAWDGTDLRFLTSGPICLLARFFWLNWVLLLLNVVLIGFPLDGGRMFQALLWPRLGYQRSMSWAIVAGFITMLVIGVYAIAKNDSLFLCLALFIYVTCRQQWILLETGGEEAQFGYDFSQGYTSLEREQSPAAPPRKRQSWLKRWMQNRDKKRMERERETREAEERRMDELLEKVQREGLQALSDEERRFLTRVSARYRNRP